MRKVDRIQHTDVAFFRRNRRVKKSMLILGFVRLFSVNPLIRRTVGAKAVFDILDKPKGNPSLLFSGMRTHRAFRAAFCHLHVFSGIFYDHGQSFQ